MEEKKKKEVVVIPEGKCCAYTCGDCGWSDPNERDSNGKIWCSHNRAYYYPYESGSDCHSYFTRR